MDIGTCGTFQLALHMAKPWQTESPLNQFLSYQGVPLKSEGVPATTGMLSTCRVHGSQRPNESGFGPKRHLCQASPHDSPFQTPKHVLPWQVSKNKTKTRKRPTDGL